jgi:hypothetical protein
MAAKIKKGDKVVVLTGKDKGKTGEVLEVSAEGDRALVRASTSCAATSADRRTRKRHHHQGSADPPVEPRACRSQGRQADPRRLQDRWRRQEGARRQAPGETIDG